MVELFTFEEILILGLVSRMEFTSKMRGKFRSPLISHYFADMRTTLSETTFTNKPFSEIVLNNENSAKKFKEDNPILIELSDKVDEVSRHLRDKFRLRGYQAPLQDALETQSSMTHLARMTFIEQYERSVMGNNYHTVVRKADINVTILEQRLISLQERLTHIEEQMSILENEIKVIMGKQDV